MAYVAIPSGKQITVKCNIPAGIAAAMVRVENQSRNMRSVKFITVQEAVDITNGRAIVATSRPPQGLVHQFLESNYGSPSYAVLRYNGM